jgi:hypothetical protein
LAASLAASPAGWMAPVLDLIDERDQVEAEPHLA